ncbi:hydrolase or metal-binding protein [Glaciimonas sp. PCH181]|uniref:recombination directionality factor n=1 Tax=Glaciimonas sp. PCH181 TaxID=2133943 RepID=UPI000D3D2B5F|nr:hydrolase or metal-binding protein [Glaciimonas sp. PCH181]PUA19162.1 hydrolase or metal-binding protein [Glaciimonas sp. PCH181]
MIKGLAITPPILGRISIGRIVEKNGKRLPEKDDQFTITTQVQNRDGWIPHPYDEALRKEQSNHKIRAIPIRLLFNAPDLNLRAEYCLFDRQNGRPICTGNGETCRRYTASSMATLPCPSPDSCELAKAGCKPYGRLNVRIGEEEDDLGTFIFRTTGFNSIRTLAARLSYYQAVSGNLLACLPLALRLRAKSTTMSHRTPIYYADIAVRDEHTLGQAIANARELHDQRLVTGYDQSALDAAGYQGFNNGAFEESDEDNLEIVEEFYPPTGESELDGNVDGTAMKTKPTLKDKLDRKAVNAEKPGHKSKLFSDV